MVGSRRQYESEAASRPTGTEGRRAVVGALLGGFGGAFGALLAKAFFPTLAAPFNSEPIWVFPAAMAGLLAAITLALLLLPMVLKLLRGRSRTDA
jgi:hypothetical protein